MPSEPGSAAVSDAATMPYEEAFAEFVRPYWSDLHRLAHRLSGRDDADDVLQEALAAAWRKRSQFDPARGTARSWLLAIVADQSRKNARRRRPLLMHHLPEPPAEAGAANESAFDLTRALDALTERQRLAVSLFYYLDLPVPEIAQIMACSTGTVKSTLSDARRRLHFELGDDYR